MKRRFWHYAIFLPSLIYFITPVYLYFSGHIDIEGLGIVTLIWAIPSVIPLVLYSRVFRAAKASDFKYNGMNFNKILLRCLSPISLLLITLAVFIQRDDDLLITYAIAYFIGAFVFIFRLKLSGDSMIFGRQSGNVVLKDSRSGNLYISKHDALHSVLPSEQDSYRNMIANGQLRAVMFDSAKISGFDASAPSIPLSAVSIPIQDFSPHHAFDPASSMGINPTTGIPMISGAIDAGGNTWGSGHTIDAFPANGFANGADTFTNPNSGYDYHSPSANPGYDPNRGY